MRLAVPALIVALTLSACATTETQANDSDVYDPWEGWNRGVYQFNETVDKAAIGPVADAYRVATPGFFREGVHNFLTNLRQPVVFANTVLQGNPDASGETFGRFLINSTAGVAGLFDVASTLGVAEHNEDFGQTLGVWGVSEGPFLMLPLLGPSNTRDTLGFGVDYAFDPLNYAEYENDDEINIGLTILGAVNARSRVDQQIETLRSQLEPYIALRRTYTSQRRAAVRNGEIEDDPYKDLPDFDDYEGSVEESGPAQEQE